VITNTVTVKDDIFMYLLQAVSAFAPICNPVQCPWGQKAFSGYLGSDRSTWEVRPLQNQSKPFPLNGLIKVRQKKKVLVCLTNRSSHGSAFYHFQAYDATVLAASYSGPKLDILIDQGRDDQFLSASQLLPDNLIAVCSEKKIPVVFRLQPVSSS